MQKGRGFSRALSFVSTGAVRLPLGRCCLLPGGSFFRGRFWLCFSGLFGCWSESICAAFSRKNSAHGFERVSPRRAGFWSVPNHVSLVPRIHLSLVPDEDVVSRVNRAPHAL